MTSEAPQFPCGTEAAVINDIMRRQAMGFQKYGTTVAENPLHLDDWLQHAYEEALDFAIYLKRAMEERASQQIKLAVKVSIKVETEEEGPARG